MRSNSIRTLVLTSLLCLGIQGFAQNLVINDITWDQIPIPRGASNANYRVFVVIPEGHEKNRWVFEADNSAGNFAITVNGRKIGEFVSPIVRFPLSNLKAGTNTVEFFCSKYYENLTQVSPKTNPYRELALKNRGNVGRKMGFQGPVRFVELADPGDIRQAYVETSVRNKELKLFVKVSATRDFKGKVLCNLREWKSDKVVQSFTKDFDIKRGEQQLELVHPWKDPKLWDVGQPNLYMAEVKLLENNQPVDVCEPFRFGFREVWTEGLKVMMNGHPIHFRMEMAWMPLNPKTLGFFKYIGRNTYYLQPHGNNWWGWWGEIPKINEEALDICDENGILVCCPGTGVSHMYELFNTENHASYRKNLTEWIDLFRNRPSIVAWGLSMNSYNPKHSIAPNLLGQREKPLDSYHEWHGKQVSITHATDICREVDPTRLAYGHADGNIGSFGSGNCYPNMTPLQELIEYPAYWAKHGDMPWMAVEFGVYDGSFLKDQVLFLTEYASIYFGDQAYERETLEQLMRTREMGSNGGYYGGNLISEVAKTSSLYWDFMSLFTSLADRYWRTYGVLGWQHFWGARYGQEDVGGWNKIDRTEADEAPTWASRQVEINRVNMQELLAYIGGNELPSDRTHIFYEGEEMVKQFTIVWDGANDTGIWLEWQISDGKGEIIKKGTAGGRAKAGEVTKIPFKYKMPEVGKRATYDLRLKTTAGKQSMIDHFKFESLPRLTDKVKGQVNRTFLYDPMKQSQWVHEVVTNVTDWVEGQALKAGDILIVGREGLNVNVPLPYTMEQINEGLRVLVLEQQPTLWQAFGFRLTDMMPRLVYRTPYSGPFMSGLGDSDLTYWRGSPNLLPEYKHARQVLQPLKGVNRHAVASTVFEIPDFPGVEPIFQCEFDQRFSPLLRIRGTNGRGWLLLSTFDFTNRIGKDPAATQLAYNVMRELIHGRNGSGRRQIVTRVEGSNELWKAQILLNEGKVDPKTDEFLKAGGVVLNLALEDDQLTSRGVQFKKEKLWRVKWLPQWNGPNIQDAFIRSGVTRNLLRWRDEMTVNVITDPRPDCGGIYLKKGNESFLQVESSQLMNRYVRGDWQFNNTLSALAIDLLKARTLTILGAGVPADIQARLNTIAVSSPYQVLKTWFAYGPFAYTNAEHVGTFSDVLPGEEQAISGDMNPNITHRTDANWKQAKVAFMDEATQKKGFDFRRMVEEDENGSIDLTKTFELAGRPAYVYMIHHWEEEADGEAVFAFNFPSKAVVYLNGEIVFDARNFIQYGEGSYENKPNTFPVRLKYQKGENVMTVKLVTLPKSWEAGTQCFGVTRAIEGVSRKAEDEIISKIKLYNEKGNIDHVYRYHFW